MSVSFAAVQYIKEKFNNIAGKKILLLGVGKIGRNTCKNLVDYLHATNITLVNRSSEKAATLARELQLHHAPLEQLALKLAEADILIIATNSPTPIINRTHLEGKGHKLVIDLSVPFSVDKNAQGLQNVQMVNIDELAKIKDETLQKRQSEVPKAKVIITRYIAEFMDWYVMRKNAMVFRIIKSKLQEMQALPLCGRLFSEDTNLSEFDLDKKIQSVINNMAVKMRRKGYCACYYLEAINEFLNNAK